MASTEWLGESWLTETDPLIDLASPLTALVQLTVSGTPSGDVRYHRHYEQGRVVSSGAGPTKGADLALTLPVSDARAVLAGQLDLSVAFMQGRLKTAGDNGILFGFLSGWASPAGVTSMARLRAAAPDG